MLVKSYKSLYSSNPNKGVTAKSFLMKNVCCMLILAGQSKRDEHISGKILI